MQAGQRWTKCSKKCSLWEKPACIVGRDMSLYKHAGVEGVGRAKEQLRGSTHSKLSLKWSQFKHSRVLDAFDLGHFWSRSDSVSINFPSDQSVTHVCWKADRSCYVGNLGLAEGSPASPQFFSKTCYICSLFYMFCVWLCAKTELRLIPQSKFLFATNDFQGQMVKLNQKGRRRAVLMLCVFNGLSKHTAKQLSNALQAQSSCPSRWVLRSLSSPSHGFHLLLLPMSCGNVRPGGKKHEMTPLYQWRLATLTRIFQAPLLRPTTIRSTSNWPLVKKASWRDTNFLKLNLFFLYLHSLWHPNPVFIHFPFYSLWLSYDLLNLPAFCMFPMNHVLSGSQVWVSLRALQI